MRCPSCSCDNPPVRESSTVVGSKVKHPAFCGSCGAALTETCPVCTYYHPVGTKFCQADGREIEAGVNERNAFRRLAQTFRASLTVRPATAALWILLAMLPVWYFIGGYFFREFLRTYRSNAPIDEFFLGTALEIVITVLLSLVVSFVPMAIVDTIEANRRQKLFDQQGYRVLAKPEEVGAED